MVLSGGAMLHALPKRPNTALPPHPRLSYQQPIPQRPPSTPHSTLGQHQQQHHNPPPLALSSNILLSQIPLPPNPVIAYRQLGPTDHISNPAHAVELVRRQIVASWDPSHLLASLLVTVKIDSASISLWLFAVASDSPHPPLLFQQLDSLQFDSLHGIRSGRFSPVDVFPCSPECNHPSKACDKCTQDPLPIRNNYPSSTLLPRPVLRVPYSSFLDACRERLIDRITLQALSQPSPVYKLNDGIVYGNVSRSGHWSASWDSQKHRRPLIYCRLHLTLLQDQILLQPLFRSSTFYPLPSHPLPGSPIVLLPHAAPAFFIGRYSGPTDHLKSEFRLSLSGLGCPSWESDEFVVCWLSIPSADPPSGIHQSAPPPPRTEDQGLAVVWPRRLCLATSSPSRSLLSPIPHIPPSVCLTASPPNKKPASEPVALAVGTQSIGAPGVQPNADSHPEAFHSAADSLKALKALTIEESRNLDQVAQDTSAFIDKVVQDRARTQQQRDSEAKHREKELQDREKERERERMRGIINPPSVKPRLGFAGFALGSSFSRIPKLTPPPPVSPITPAPPPLPSVSNPQGFYPSPPELNHPPGDQGLAISLPHNPPVDPQHLQGRGPAVGIGTFPIRPADTSMDLGVIDNNAFGADFSRSLADDGAFTSAEFSASLLNMNLNMNMEEDFTEDDFNFFDEPDTVPLSTLPELPIDPAPRSRSDSLFGESTESWLPPIHPTMLPESISIPPLNLQPPSAIFAASSSSGLPISPARTPSSNQSEPQTPDLNLAILPPNPPETPSALNPQPPEFPYRTKEYVSKAYEPIPFPASDYAADQKYLAPGGKFSMTKLPPSPTPSLTEDDGSVVASAVDGTRSPLVVASQSDGGGSENAPFPFTPQFGIPSEAPQFTPFYMRSPPAKPRTSRRSLHQPSKKLQAEAEAARAKRREQKRLDKIEQWHSPYFPDKFAFMTDPRVQHIRRLRGTKRYPDFNAHPHTRELTDINQRGTWMRTSEFVDIVPPLDVSEDETETTTDGGVNAEGSDTETDGDSPAEDDAAPARSSQGEDGTWLPNKSTVRTPTPITPSTENILATNALHTHFHPLYLAPFITHPVSTSSAVPPQQVSLSRPMSVPTPVSPAANLMSQASNEAILLLEASADVISKEVVENPVWAGSFRAWFGWRNPQELVWSAEVNLVAALMQTALNVKERFSIQKVTECAAPFSYATKAKAFVPPSRAPLVSVGHLGSVLQMTLPSLRFWEKLGITPLSGPKDVMAFTLFDSSCDSLQNRELIQGWMQQLSTTYSTRGFGRHTAGSPELGSYADGLVVFKWDSIKKTILELAATIPKVVPNVVLYIVTNPPNARITCTPFSHLASLMTRMRSRLPTLEQRISFHLVPRDVVLEPRSFPSSRHLGYELLALLIYNSVLQRIERELPRKFFKYDLVRTNRYIQTPAFTLARESPPKFDYILLDWPPATKNTADRHTLLHVGYGLSAYRDWLALACVDERGEAHETKTRYINVGDYDEDDIYNKICSHVISFALKFAGLADMEWCIVITRLGAMTEPELTAWEKCLHRDVVNASTPFHVTIACYNWDASLTPLPCNAGESKEVAPHTSFSFPRLHPKTSSSAFYDVSSGIYVLYPWYRTPLLAPSPCAQDGVNLVAARVNDVPQATITAYPLLPLSSAYFFHMPNLGDHSSHPVPGTSDYTKSISSTQFHILHTTLSSTSSFRKPLYVHLRDVAKNFTSLALLTRERFGIDSYGCLPFHLSAVDIMLLALAHTRDLSI